MRENARKRRVSRGRVMPGHVATSLTGIPPRGGCLGETSGDGRTYHSTRLLWLFGKGARHAVSRSLALDPATTSRARPPTASRPEWSCRRVRARELKLAAGRARRGANVAGIISRRVDAAAPSRRGRRGLPRVARGGGGEEKERKRPPTGSRPNSTVRAREYPTVPGDFFGSVASRDNRADRCRRSTSHGSIPADGRLRFEDGAASTPGRSAGSAASLRRGARFCRTASLAFTVPRRREKSSGSDRARVRTGPRPFAAPSDSRDGRSVDQTFPSEKIYPPEKENIVPRGDSFNYKLRCLDMRLSGWFFTRKHGAGEWRAVRALSPRNPAASRGIRRVFLAVSPSGIFDCFFFPSAVIH